MYFSIHIFSCIGASYVGAIFMYSLFNIFLFVVLQETCKVILIVMNENILFRITGPR